MTAPWPEVSSRGWSLKSSFSNENIIEKLQDNLAAQNEKIQELETVVLEVRAKHSKSLKEIKRLHDIAKVRF